MHRQSAVNRCHLVVLASLGLGAAGRLAAHDLVSFEADVKPVLQKSCGGTECHVGRSQSGVELTSYATLMASVGEQYAGPIVVPGDPDASPLIDKVASAQPRFGEREPRGADPLTDAEVSTLRRWVREGAKVTHAPLRGDFDLDDTLNITDAVAILNFLFLGAEPPRCNLLVDANADGDSNLSDAVFVLVYLFLGGPAPRELGAEETAACFPKSELSFASIAEKVFATSCAFSSCHSDSRRKAGLALGSREEAYRSLVGVSPTNEAALAAGLLRVDPGKPENSFLLKKLTAPGPGEGNRMPSSSSSPLPERAIAAIREWILAGAPLEGTIPGVPDLDDATPPPSGGLSQPPVPESGVQLHLVPFTIGARSEREIFYFVDKPFAGRTEDVVVERIDIHMTEASHHMILYEWISATKPPAGVRDSSFANFLTSQRFIAGAQQSFFSVAFPPGVGLKFSRNASFDLNSHYINLSGQAPILGEVYVNIFFAAPGSITTFVKPIFDINPSINVPPHETRTTKWSFPGVTSTQQDPALGSNGRVARETHIYSLSSHMHRHGVRFTGFLIQNGRDLSPPRMLYDNPDWDDPVFKVFDPPLVLQPGQGIRFETTHTYDDPPSDNSPALTFGPTSEDEMAILLGFYALK
ncbi:MAG: hypothetical protein HY721_11580 [Planctomycetes bacterium]|nr:hypothetical protein [Planctomycetota bacterium]